MKYPILFFFAFSLVNCNKVKNIDVNKTDKKTITVLKQKNEVSKLETNIPLDTLEVFKDSLTFGDKKQTKIIIIKIGNDDSAFVNIFLFKKQENKWKINDTLTLENITFPKLHPKIEDFNNDGFHDIIFTSSSGTRGGNNIETLILYSPKEASLNWIKNSENYPNLRYNKKLNCIDACILTGGETTYFLKIKRDSLKEFARVKNDNGTITSEKNNVNGHWKEIKTIKNQSREMRRFINYDPIEEKK